MKIYEINHHHIKFNNGNCITYSCPDESYAYADFQYLDLDSLDDIEFNNHLKFEVVDKYGFRFGSNPQQMLFVPCYASDSGYYSSDIEIYYCKKKVLKFNTKYDKE